MSPTHSAQLNVWGIASKAAEVVPVLRSAYAKTSKYVVTKCWRPVVALRNGAASDCHAPDTPQLRAWNGIPPERQKAVVISSGHLHLVID